MAEASENKKVDRKARRRRVGVVISDSRDKTLKVQVEYMIEHPMYGKRIRRRATIHAHDPNNEGKVGDRVQVMECRPISKTKSWRLEKVLNAARK